MTRFRIDELSGVDKAAQDGALVTIMKRDDRDFDPVIQRHFSAGDYQNFAATGVSMPSGAFPIQTRADLGHAIKGIARAHDEAGTREHIVRRAKAIHAEDMLPDGWAPAGKAAEPAPRLGTVAEFVDGLAKQRASLTGESFEKAYSELISAGGGVAYAALKAERAAWVG